MFIYIIAATIHRNQLYYFQRPSKVLGEASWGCVWGRLDSLRFHHTWDTETKITCPRKVCDQSVLLFRLNEWRPLLICDNFYTGIVIPANSDLTYEVKLLFTNDADSMIEAFEAIDYDGDGYLDPNEVIEISIAIKICT